MQFSSKQVVARHFKTFWGPTEVMTAFYNANLLRRITLFSFLDCGPFKRLAAPLRSNRGPRAFVSRLMICIVFYELYAHLHRVLRALRKFAPCFTGLTQICTVFYDVYANLHRILRCFTQICIVFYWFYANLHRVLRAFFWDSCPQASSGELLITRFGRASLGIVKTSQNQGFREGLEGSMGRGSNLKLRI